MSTVKSKRSTKNNSKRNVKSSNRTASSKPSNRRTASKSSNRTSSVSNSSKRRTSNNSSNRRTSNNNYSASINSITNGINIIKRAIKDNSSISAAAQASGKGRNYISDIKARLEENYRSKNITKELYNSFVTINKQYQKSK